MAEAVALGDGARGGTAPNPNVGCVLVKDGRIVGRGATGPAVDPMPKRSPLPKPAPRPAARPLM
jgi:diaminohydroxyphosphoribosylaminopyrimidine deaminase/5-amino-6-(5-phosphoribosylamino)uracil reductase